jgi:hypothetical protein
VLVLAGCGSGIGASSKAQVGFACGNVIPPALPRSGPGITARFEDASDVVAFTNSSKSHTTYGVGVTYGSNPNDGGSIQGYFLDDDKRTVVSSGYVTADVKGLVTTSPNEDVPAVEQPKSAPGSTIRIAVTKLMNQCDNNGETTAKPIAAGTYWFSAALSVFRLSSSGEPRRTGVLYATEPVKVHVG